MTDQPQTIEVRAVPPRVPRAPATPKPKVSLRRVAVATADTAALAAAGGTAAFGAAGMLAGAAGAVAVPLAVKAHRKAAERRAATRAQRTTTTRTSTSGARSGGLSGGRRSGGTGSSTSGRRSRSGSTGSGSSGGLFGKRSRSSSGSSAGRSSGGLFNRRSRSGSAGSSAGRSQSGGLFNRRSRSGSSGDGSSGGPFRRWRDRHHARALARGLARDGERHKDWVARRRARKARGPWWKRLKRKPTTVAPPVKPGPGTTLRGATTNQPKSPTKFPINTPTNVQPAPVPAPARRTAVAPTGPIARMQAAADDMLTAARQHHPDGNLEVLAGYQQLPAVLETVHAAIAEFDRSAADQGLHPAVQDLIAATRKVQQSVIAASEAIAPAIERLHAEELAYLRKNASARWDRRVNPDAPARRPSPGPRPNQPVANTWAARNANGAPQA